MSAALSHESHDKAMPEPHYIVKKLYRLRMCPQNY